MCERDGKIESSRNQHLRTLIKLKWGYKVKKLYMPIFFKPTLKRASINYLGLIKILTRPAHWAQPTQISYVAPNKPFGFIMGHLSTVQKPKKTHVKPYSPNILILWLLGSNIIRLIKGSSWSPIVSSPTLKLALDSLSVGPKGQKSPVGY